MDSHRVDEHLVAQAHLRDALEHRLVEGREPDDLDHAVFIRRQIAIEYLGREARRELELRDGRDLLELLGIEFGARFDHRIRDGVEHRLVGIERLVGASVGSFDRCGPVLPLEPRAAR